MNDLYCVYDALAEEYGPPFPAKNDAVASRKAKQMLQGYDLVGSPELKLFQVGSLDVSSGTLSGIIPREVILSQNPELDS